jgi:para-aminobenzoate synthetase component 1
VTASALAADWAVVDGRLHSDLVDVSDDLGVLDGAGHWIVVLTFEGAARCLRFARSQPLGDWWDSAHSWEPPARWSTSLDQASYEAAVDEVRERIAAGEVYQANICRILSAPVPRPPDMHALGAALARGNPAPYAAVVNAPGADVFVASASPELFLHRDGERVSSGPIKGTGVTAADLTDKDRAENVMIVDLVRNDLGRVATTGSVDVSSLLRTEHHPGLVHLVSTVVADVPAATPWAQLLDATFPPASVTGAPKSSALHIIGELEPAPRGVYCGAVGWVDADRNCGTLAVAIRTFEWRDGRLHLGTGAGITWGSDPRREWQETELKVRTLLAVR